MTKQKRHRKNPVPYKMQEKGFEPSQYCYHTDLNRARLPIPPFLHAKVILTLGFVIVNAIFL